MTTIWKFAMPNPTPRLYIGDKVIHVGTDPTQPAIPTVWLEVHQTAGIENMRRLCWIGTGHDVPEDGTHVGSVVTPDGLVWHVYDVTEAR